MSGASPPDRAARGLGLGGRTFAARPSFSALSCALFSALAFAAGCPPKEPTRPPAAGPVDADADVIAPLPDPVREPTNRETGEELTLTIPRVGGDALDLAELRGRTVILELSAAWVEGWSGRYALYNSLLREHGAGRLAVVLVAMDGDRAAISAEPEVRAEGFELAWDPQGAIAAQLQAAAVPTVIILDAGGRIAQIVATDVSPRAIVDALSSTLATP